MKKPLFLSLLLAASLPVMAENNGRYLDLAIGGGAHSLQYAGSSAESGASRPGAGGQFNLAYRYMFHRHWGFSVGFDLTYLHASANIDLTVSDLYRFSDWNEEENLLKLNIPAGICFQTPVGDRWDFAWGAGAKLSFLEYNNYYASGLLNGNAATFGGSVSDSDIPRIGCDIFADLGFHYAVNERVLLYIGLYGSYSPTNRAAGGNTPLYTVSDDKAYYRGLLGSDVYGRAHDYTCGLKFGVTFRFPSQEELDSLPDTPLPEVDESDSDTWRELE